MGEKEQKVKELIEKYNIDIDKLEKEQLKLSKSIDIKDKIDFNLADRIAGIENIFVGNVIISAIVVVHGGEIVEQEYFKDKIRFPYIPGLRAYRELSNMVSVFNMLDEKPDVVLIRAHGIIHPRGLGLASHFSLATGVSSVGIADSLLIGEQEGDDIILNNQIVGKIIESKQGANPLYISPGNLISVESSAELVRRLIKYPYKIPEPLRLAKKYTKNLRKELFQDKI